MESYLTAEISASAVRANLELLRGLLAPGTALCAVVKADCYGLGLEGLLGVICEQADSLAVVTPQEAIALRRLGYEREILMLFSPCGFADGKELDEALGELIASRVTLTLMNSAEVAGVAAAAGKVGTDAEVHVMIDTGMGRGGVPEKQAPELIETVRATDGLKLTGLCTHFATADESDKDFARRQLSSFLAVTDATGGRTGLTLHAANSAALIDLPETHLDMVRPGIAVYGYQPSDQMHTKLPLKPALRLWSRLMQVKDAPAGSRCGYGLAHTFEKDSRIGLVPVGYADGYFRSLSNAATMRIDGIDVPVRGRVSMDQTIIDLTEVPEVRVGDVVEIITPDPAAPNSVENLARLAGTIPYEIITTLGTRVKRVLVN
ncbi:MAG: alanine racemase [Planctomycetota bacterium]|jgi:alanine racemase